MDGSCMKIKTAAWLSKEQYDFDDLIDLMLYLSSDEGCPWDQHQNHQRLTKYFLEEVYEVIEAIHSQNDHQIQEELGDVLLQVAYHIALSERRQGFDRGSVVDGIVRKMIRRHSHIFGSDCANSTEALRTLWYAHKTSEYEASKHSSRESESVLGVCDEGVTGEFSSTKPASIDPGSKKSQEDPIYFAETKLRYIQSGLLKKHSNWPLLLRAEEVLKYRQRLTEYEQTDVPHKFNQVVDQQMEQVSNERIDPMIDDLSHEVIDERIEAIAKQIDQEFEQLNLKHAHKSASEMSDPASNGWRHAFSQQTFIVLPVSTKMDICDLVETEAQSLDRQREYGRALMSLLSYGHEMQLSADVCMGLVLEETRQACLDQIEVWLKSLNKTQSPTD